MSDDRRAQIDEGNTRLRELNQHSWLRYDKHKPTERRWCVYEKMDFTAWTGAASDIDRATSAGVTTEACVCEASTPTGALASYWESWQDENRMNYFREAHLRGNSLDIPPPETEAQRTSREAADHQRGRAQQNVNEAIKRQLHHLGKRILGIGDATTFQKMFRGR